VIPIRKRVSLPNGLIGRLACAALALCMPAVACAETLADALAAAYDRNPQLVQQRYLQKARDEGYVQARAQYGPTVTAQTQGSYIYEKKSTAAWAHGTSQESTLTINQPLYSSGRLRGQLAACPAPPARKCATLTRKPVVHLGGR